MNFSNWIPFLFGRRHIKDTFETEKTFGLKNVMNIHSDTAHNTTQLYKTVHISQT